ncbi:MAG: MATE family efflux transporter [Pseudomonadales bacterium]|nr:MATE family efflux transporter [Pseudomonadales bacterium]
MSSKYDPVSGRVITVFLHYAIPSVVGMLCLSSAFMIDGIFIGNFVGTVALAAVNLAMPVWSGLFAVITMLAIGSAVMCGKYLGEEDYSAAKDIFTKSLTCSVFIALLSCLLGIVFLDSLVVALGATVELAPLVSSYLVIIFAFSPAFLLGFFLFYFVRIDSNPLLASFSLIASAFINVLLDWFFIVELEMGIAGAAYATGMAHGSVLLVLLPHFFRRASRLKLIHLAGSWSDIPKALANGFSEFANEMSIGLTTLLLNWIMITRLGVSGVAAFTIVNYLFFIGLMTFYGIGESLQPLISKNYGARQAAKMSDFVRIALVSNLLIAIVLCGILLTLPQILIGFFLQPGEGATMDIATRFLYYFWPAFLFSGMNITLSGFFTACHKPGLSASIALSRSLVLPLLFLLTLPVWLGDIGVFISIPLAECITFIMALVFISKNKPRHIVDALTTP